MDLGPPSVANHARRGAPEPRQRNPAPRPRHAFSARGGRRIRSLTHRSRTQRALPRPSAFAIASGRIRRLSTHSAVAWGRGRRRLASRLPVLSSAWQGHTHTARGRVSHGHNPPPPSAARRQRAYISPAKCTSRATEMGSRRQDLLVLTHELTHGRSPGRSPRGAVGGEGGALAVVVELEVFQVLIELLVVHVAIGRLGGCGRAAALALLRSRRKGG